MFLQRSSFQKNKNLTCDHFVFGGGARAVNIRKPLRSLHKAEIVNMNVLNRRIQQTCRTLHVHMESGLWSTVLFRSGSVAAKCSPAGKWVHGGLSLLFLLFNWKTAACCIWVKMLMRVMKMDQRRSNCKNAELKDAKMLRRAAGNCKVSC